MNQDDLMNMLYLKYKLTKQQDVYAHKHYTILTRPGIEKIQAGENITITFEDRVLEPEFAVIKAIAVKGEKTVETYGSAKKGSYKDGNTNTWYVTELAEKRALSRAVLKMANLYEHGAFSEDESDEFKKANINQ